jgi:hypothetical protein
MILAFMLLCACAKEETNPLNFSGTGKWWYVKYIDIPANTGSYSIHGKLDYGNFYFYPNGSYSRKYQPIALSSLQFPESYIIYPNGAGVPMGDISSGAVDSSWSIHGNILTISNYGTWRIIELKEKGLTIKSDRTDYNYTYTLVAD